MTHDDRLAAAQSALSAHRDTLGDGDPFTGVYAETLERLNDDLLKAQAAAYGIDETLYVKMWHWGLKGWW